MIDPKFDPLKQLQDMEKFCIQADAHIVQMSKNQELLVAELKRLKTRIDHLEDALYGIQEKVYEQTGKRSR